MGGGRVHPPPGHTHPSTLYLHLLTEWITHACENITFPQLRLRAVKISCYRCSLSRSRMKGERKVWPSDSLWRVLIWKLSSALTKSEWARCMCVWPYITFNYVLKLWPTLQSQAEVKSSMLVPSQKRFHIIEATRNITVMIGAHRSM